MREIKFRAWKADIKEMSNPFDLFDNDEYYLLNGDAMDVSDAVIMQYTGLHDKNGEEIYESDLLRLGETKSEKIFPLAGEEQILNVWFEDGCFMTEEGTVADVLSWHNAEIVGNTYENPHLLKEGAV